MNTTQNLVQAYQGELPSDYQSLVSREYKVAYAFELAELTRSRGFTPVAVSVTGSTLRGQDTETSDVDALVLVGDKNFKTRTWEDDVQVQSLERYVDKLATSVPYVEFLRSPFMVADQRYLPYLRAQEVNPFVFAAHAQRFAGHTWFRREDKEKAYRHCFATWNVLQTGSPLVPRRFMNQDNAPEEFRTWLEESLMDYQEAEERRRLEAELARQGL